MPGGSPSPRRRAAPAPNRGFETPSGPPLKEGAAGYVRSIWNRCEHPSVRLNSLRLRDEQVWRNDVSWRVRSSHFLVSARDCCLLSGPPAPLSWSGARFQTTAVPTAKPGQGRGASKGDRPSLVLWAYWRGGSEGQLSPVPGNIAPQPVSSPFAYRWYSAAARRPGTAGGFRRTGR